MTSIEEALPRYQPENPYKYTNVELAKRRKALKDIQKDYPTVNAAWTQWLYDVIESMPEEEVKQIMNKNLWDTPRMNKSAK